MDIIQNAADFSEHVRLGYISEQLFLNNIYESDKFFLF